MTLRSRIALALLVITTVLVAPAIYGVTQLNRLQGIAGELQTQDARALLELGRLQSSLQELAQWQRSYYAFAGDTAAMARAEQSVQEGIAEFELALRDLAGTGYAEQADSARIPWAELRETAEEEQGLIQAGHPALAEAYREERVVPAFAAVEQSLRSIGEAIDRRAQHRADTAAEVAAEATGATLLALALALALSLLVAAYLTRSLVSPISELRRGMGVVAAGDLEPDLKVPLDRPDELGDLARSFDRMTQQLAELDRLKAEFVSVASHELKTPLSVIKGYVSLLLEGIYGGVPAEQQKVLRSVAEQSDRLARLIQQLLDVSRFEAGGGRLDLRPIPFAAFLQDLATSFEALAIQNQIDFRLDVQEPLPDTILADPDRLNEVIGNLLSNAFKFTPREGRIKLRAVSAEGGVQVQVEDSGVGIPHDQLPRVFEKFYQVDNALQPRSIGSGLGLAISKEIVTAHGGTITAASEVDRGTTFTVFLPDAGTPADSSFLVTEAR